MSRLVGWLGGALFVASLAWSGWWYFITLRGAASGPHWPALAWDAALLTAFAAHHSLFARDALKRRLAMIVPPHLVRTLYVAVASALFIAVILLWRPVGGELYSVTGAATALLLAVQLLGVWLIYRAVAGIDPLELAGIRAAAGLGRRPELLQTEGPYRWVRHPLYLGWTLIVFGVAHMTGDRLTFAVLTSIYLLAAIPFEERSLIQSFGDPYVRYRARVRWRMLPFIY